MQFYLDYIKNNIPSGMSVNETKMADFSRTQIALMCIMVVFVGLCIVAIIDMRGDD